MLTKERKSFIGLYRQRVQFQEYVTTTTPSGGTTQTWENLEKRWTKIKPLSGRERRQVDQSQSEVTHDIELRYEITLSNSQIRAVYRDRIFNIQFGINKGEENTYMELSASELTDDS